MSKTINVEKLIKEAIHHKFIFNEETQQVEDNLAEFLDNTDEDTYYYVGINQFVVSYFYNHPDTEWDVFGIFQLGFPYLYPASGILNKEKTSIIKIPETYPGLKICNYLNKKTWSLFVFKKKNFEKTVIGFLNTNDSKLAYSINDRVCKDCFCVFEENQLGMPSYNQAYNLTTGKKTSPYIDYFKAIQKIIEKDTVIERRIEFESYRDVEYEFVEIPKDMLLSDYLPFIYRYKSSVIDLFGYPNDEEQLVFLENEVEFIEKSSEIKRGDILINYLSINISERKVKIQVTIADKDKSKAKHQYILRSKKLSPYYILSYFQSDFLKELILNTYSQDKEDIVETIEKYRDTKDELDFYRAAYYFNHFHNNDDDWVDLEIHNIPIIVNHSVDTEFFEKKYQWEKQQKLSIQRRLEKDKKSLIYNTNAREIIIRDIRELKECFNRGVYKAAIIMAGSILEAFLIDWLSEIHNTNYFDEDYLVFDTYRKKYRRANLKDYISIIAELKKPNWFDAAKKATEIRKKRNLVHAKLYINDNDISRETCTEVINFLESVINTRWQ